MLIYLSKTGSNNVWVWAKANNSEWWGSFHSVIGSDELYFKLSEVKIGEKCYCWRFLWFAWKILNSKLNFRSVVGLRWQQLTEICVHLRGVFLKCAKRFNFLGKKNLPINGPSSHLNPRLVPPRVWIIL